MSVCELHCETMDEEAMDVAHPQQLLVWQDSFACAGSRGSKLMSQLHTTPDAEGLGRGGRYSMDENTPPWVVKTPTLRLQRTEQEALACFPKEWFG